MSLSTATAEARGPQPAARSGGLAYLYAVVLLLVLGWLLRDSGLLPDWAITVPRELQLPLDRWINVVVDLLRYDLGLLSVTRGLAEGLGQVLSLTRGLLYAGFSGLDLPPLPWLLLVGLAAILGHALGGLPLAVLAGGSLAYMVVFGQWDNAMITLSIVLVAMVLAALLGLALGILAVRSRSFERLLLPLLSVLQSLPHFSYLIPVVVFFGVGQAAGAIATIVFAMPPMARLTILGLRSVPPEVIEAGTMAGCSERQLLFRCRIPAARQTLMVGVNQVIMQCLAMVVIASFIGTPGLGYDLLLKLQSLRIGQALESGVAIVLMAISLDRLSQALARRQPRHREARSLAGRHPYLLLAAGWSLAAILLAMLFEAAQVFPADWRMSTAPFWDGLVRFITVRFYDSLEFIRDGMLIHLLIPLRGLFQSLPWLVVLAAVMLGGWALGRLPLALTVGGFIGFIALTGFWDRAMITSYMVVFAVVVCLLVGVPFGIWAAGSAPRMRVVQAICDSAQTFPSFIYLIPVIMLFRVSDVAVITAVVLYSVVPAIRYTMVGLDRVPKTIVEAATTSGCTRWQLLWKVRLPLALPTMMVGLNQTIMFALFMVIIGAFIGTRDLGQEIMRALSASDVGKGLMLGLCVAFLGLTADRLITAWSDRQRRRLGLA